MRIVRVDPVIAIKASIDLHLRTSKTLRALINYIEKSK
jgi:hypothetical protein